MSSGLFPGQPGGSPIRGQLPQGRVDRDICSLDVAWGRKGGSSRRPTQCRGFSLVLSSSSHMAHRRGCSFLCFTDEQVGAQRRQLPHARLLSRKVPRQVVRTTRSCENPRSLTALSWNSDSRLPHERLNGQYPISTGEGFKNTMASLTPQRSMEYLLCQAWFTS